MNDALFAQPVLNEVAGFTFADLVGIVALVAVLLLLALAGRHL